MQNVKSVSNFKLCFFHYFKIVLILVSSNFSFELQLFVIQVTVSPRMRGHTTNIVLYVGTLMKHFVSYNNKFVLIERELSKNFILFFQLSSESNP